MGLSEEESAFYEALEINESAVQVLGDETLTTITRELVDAVKRNTTIDWTVKESVRAKLRVLVKGILRKHGYPPDLQERATKTVLEQAELLADLWLRRSSGWPWTSWIWARRAETDGKFFNVSFCQPPRVPSSSADRLATNCSIR